MSIEWVIGATTVVPKDFVALAQGLSEAFAGEAGAGMWTTGLSPDGLEHATHYISSGPMDRAFYSLLGDSEGTVAAAEAAGISLDLPTIQALYDATVISDGTLETLDLEGNTVVTAEGPHELLKRLGLKMVQPPEQV